MVHKVRVRNGEIFLKNFVYILKLSIGCVHRVNKVLSVFYLIILCFVYLRIKLLAHITSAIMKSRDGVSTPDASNSNSQCSPVNPIGQTHSYFFGGL